MTAATDYRPTYAAEQLKAWLRRWDRWKSLCDELSSLKESQLGYEEALAAWRKGRVPSKNSKHHAYGYAYTLMEWLNRNGHSIERGHDVAYLRTVLAAAKSEGLVK